jgi:hypothetical protein
MKPTISTSFVRWSCTTAGINPSSFEKSILVTFVAFVVFVPFAVQQKTPPDFRRGGFA